MRPASIKLGVAKTIKYLLDRCWRHVVKVRPAAAVVPRDGGPAQIFVNDPRSAHDRKIDRGCTRTAETVASAGYSSKISAEVIRQPRTSTRSFDIAHVAPLRSDRTSIDALKEGSQILDTPSQSAIDPDRSDGSIFKASPFAQRLWLTINQLGCFIRRKDSRQRSEIRGAHLFSPFPAFARR